MVLILLMVQMPRYYILLVIYTTANIGNIRFTGGIGVSTAITDGPEMDLI